MIIVGSIHTTGEQERSFVSVGGVLSHWSTLHGVNGLQQLSPATVVIGVVLSPALNSSPVHVIVSHIIGLQHVLESVPGVVVGLSFASSIPCGAT